MHDYLIQCPCILLLRTTYPSVRLDIEHPVCAPAWLWSLFCSLYIRSGLHAAPPHHSVLIQTTENELRGHTKTRESHFGWSYWQFVLTGPQTLGAEKVEDAHTATHRPRIYFTANPWVNEPLPAKSAHQGRFTVALCPLQLESTVCTR